MSRGFQAVLTAAVFAFTTLAVPPMTGLGMSEAQAATTSGKSNVSKRKKARRGGCYADATTLKSASRIAAAAGSAASGVPSS